MTSPTTQNFMPPTGARVAVAMSGGVDSAVAALLMVRAGHKVTGVTLKLWCSDTHPERETEKACCSREAIDDAASTAARLGFPHHVWDFSAEFQEAVITPFRETYFSGRTPNPCVDCNRNVRFTTLYDKLRAAGFDYLVTGHYARVLYENGEPQLFNGVDPKKDQSYVLWGIGADALAHTCFPLGDLVKSEVRALAAEANIPVADKEESQDICFIPDNNLGGFLGVLEQGDILLRDGTKVGTHTGAAQYTIGQRRGLGVGGGDQPLYVTRIDAIRNRVYIGPEEELYASGAVLGEVSLLVDPATLASFDLDVKIRYKHSAASGRATIDPDGRVHVRFKEPQKAITPGQSAVFFEGDRLLGGGVIDEAIPLTLTPAPAGESV